MNPILKLNYPRLARDAVKFSYNDPLTGGSPDIELTVIDRGTVPIAPKATLDVEIGRTGSPYRLKAGLFEVDRIGTAKRDGVRTIGAAGLPLSDPALRAKRDGDYSEYKLVEVLEEIAARYSLSVFSRDLPDVEFSQLAQNQQSDLDFLSALATRLGAVFKIENRQLIFTLMLDLEMRSPLFAVTSSELVDYTETVLGVNQYQYLDYEVILFGDVETIRVEDERVANGAITSYRGAGVTADDENLLILSARDQLRQINGANHLFTIDISGEFNLIAGSVFTLDDRPAFIDRAVHSIDTGDRKYWRTSLSCRYLPR